MKVKIPNIKHQDLIQYVESNYLKLKKHQIRVGDKIKLGIEIKEGGKTRTQLYEGVVISKKIQV